MYPTVSYQSFYEKPSNINRLVSQATILLKNRGREEECNVINSASISCVLTDHDNWNGGIDYYTLILSVSIKLYSRLSVEEKNLLCKHIAEAVNEIESDESFVFYCRIEPKLSSDDLDWNSIGGSVTYNKCRQCMNRMKQLLIDIATNTIALRGTTYNDEYISLFQEMTGYFNQLNYTFSGLFKSLWEWYQFYKNEVNNLSSYQSRRNFIDNLFSETETLLKTGPQDNISETVKMDDWEEIVRRTIKIKRSASTASDVEDFQSIGLQCREVLISIAKTVYKPDIHGDFDENGTKIGESDSVRQLANYIKLTLKGKENEELRSYAKTTNKISNVLTHRRTSTKTEMLLCVNATIALINFVGILEGKTWSY